MGNSSSQDGKEKKNNNNDEDCVMGVYDNVSSYKGMKTDISEKQCKQTNTQTSEITDQTIEKFPIVNDQKVEFTFEWKEGGNQVLLTGSFTQWLQNYSMVKSSDGNFYLKIMLNKGIHQFKFIVDNKWRCSQFYSTSKDSSNNVNNSIDLTNYAPIQSDKPVAEIIKRDNMNKEQSNTVTRAATNGGRNNKKDYNSIMPKSSEMNTDCPQVPLHYQKMYNIDYNTKQNIVGNNEFLQYCEKNLLSENNSYKKILVPPHVNL